MKVRSQGRVLCSGPGEGALALAIRVPSIGQRGGGKPGAGPGPCVQLGSCLPVLLEGWTGCRGGETEV